ncbi:hypothetical protein ACEQPO_10140 [Bacillus sp. SL00103]
MIEEDFLGGTCLNRGCIPSKTLLKHAEVIESIEKAKKLGNRETGDMILSFDKMRKRKMTSLKSSEAESPFIKARKD